MYCCRWKSCTLYLYYRRVLRKNKQYNLSTKGKTTKEKKAILLGTSDDMFIKK